MRRVVVYDACVLHPAVLCDLLMRVAVAGLVEARFTHRILDECMESLARRAPSFDAVKLQRRKNLMIAAVPDALVEGYEGRGCKPDHVRARWSTPC